MTVRDPGQSTECAGCQEGSRALLRMLLQARPPVDTHLAPASSNTNTPGCWLWLSPRLGGSGLIRLLVLLSFDLKWKFFSFTFIGFVK